ncbi:MAG: TRAP transporter large permease [Clostridia bacterium]|nr:TRAP transporter large permease [Clostridia bacterium]
MAMFIMLVILLVFAIFGLPLAYAIGASGISYLAVAKPLFLQMLPQRIWSGAFSYVLVAMPLFMFMGELMNKAGLTKHLLDFCLLVVRPIKGGLGEVNVLDSMIFGGISGSSVADTAALGSVVIPEMERRGYPAEFAAGITVATSTMGMMIPPSIPMIMFSMISGASVGALFMAGMVPGIMVGLLQLIVCYTISKKNGYHPKYDKKITLKEILTILVTSLPTVSMPLLIIASISFGICTASESAAVAVAYSIIVGVFLYKKLTFKDVIVALRKTLVSSASICIIIAFSNIFTWIMTMMQIPQTVASFFLGLDMPVWIALIILDLLILFLGTFIDVSPALLMLTPILLPITRGLGMSDWQFAAVFITGLAIGLVTPPVGMCLNACSKINGMSITKIGKAALPFTLCNVIVLFLVTFIPALSDFLPTLFGYMS